MKKKKISTYSAFSALLLLACAGCGLFSTPTSEPASGAPAASTPPATASALRSTSATSPARDAASRPIVFLQTDAYGNPNDIYLIDPDGTGLRRLPLDNAHPESYISACRPRPAFSPDGRTLAAVRSPFHAETVQADQGELTVKTPLDPQELAIIEVASGRVIATIASFGGSFDWSPDSQSLIYVRPLHWNLNSGAPEADQGLWVLDLASGEQRQLLPPRAGFPIASLDWSPDGSRIAFHGASFEGMGPFGMMNIDGSGFKVWEDSIGAFGWSPDGQRIAYDRVPYIAFPPSRLFVMDAGGGHATAIVNDDQKTAVQPAWSPEGGSAQQIAFLDSLEGSTTAWLVGADGANLRQVRLPGLAQISSLAWSPDARRLVVSGDRQVYLVPLDGSAPLLLGSGACATW